MKGIVIVARTRTGTNWLRELLSTSTNGQNLGEVMRPDVRDSVNFFRWYENKHGLIPAHRGEDWVTDVLTGYFDYLESHFAVPILDFKYGSFTVFDQSWRSPIAMPLVLKTLVGRGYKIIHQRRENLIENAVSEAVAAITGVYTSYATGYCPPSVTLDPAAVLRLMQEYGRELAYVSEMLSGCDKLVNLSYETLVKAEQDNTLAPLLRDLAGGTDLKFRGLRPIAIKRLLPDWRSSVRNWQEVEAFVSPAE